MILIVAERQGTRRRNTALAMAASIAAAVVGLWLVSYHQGTGAGPVFATALYLTVLQLDKGAVPVWRR